MARQLKQDLRILFINPFGIGDVLFSTPLVARVRKLFPSATVGFLCNRRVLPILQRNPDLDCLWVLERDEFRALWRQSKTAFFKNFFDLYGALRKQKFDIAFDLSLSDQFGFFLATMGVKRRIGFRYRNRGKFLNAWHVLDGYQGKHVAEHQLGLLDLLSTEVPNEGWETPRLVYRASLQDRDLADQALHDAGIALQEDLVGIAPGGGDTWGVNADYKRWPPEQFAQLSRLLMARGHRLIFLGSRADQPVVERILRDVPQPATTLAGKCPIETTAAVMLRCRLVITNDGGLLHLAAAQDVPTASFFGPTDDAVYGPFPKSAMHLVFARQLECRPCYKNFRMAPCPYDKRCLTQWQAQDVFERILSWQQQSLKTACL